MISNTCFFFDTCKYNVIISNLGSYLTELQSNLLGRSGEKLVAVKLGY